MKKRYTRKLAVMMCKYVFVYDLASESFTLRLPI